MNEVNALIWPNKLGIGVMNPVDYAKTAKISYDFKVIEKPATRASYRTDLAKKAVANLRKQGIDVYGKSFKKRVVILPARVGKHVATFLLVLGSLWALWEGYKWLWESTGWTWPFAVDDLTVPHLHSILLQLGEPTSTGDDLWLYLLRAALFTAKSAAVGFAIGAVVGFVLGVVLAQFDVLRRGVMPYVVASQTIPILALAPILVRGLGSVSINGSPPADWVRVSVIAAYLTFFPVTVNTLRGLRSADPWARELMHSYAARGWTILWKLEVPLALL